MNPDFFKYLQQITSALRSGITLGGDPLGELQKRASQIGEGFGTQFEHDRAQAGYTNALVKQYSGGEPGLRGQVRGQLDPHTQRAQQETMQNAAMLALGSLKPEASAENDLVFEHRSPKAGLKVLDAAYQGTGRAGAEAKRVDRVPMLHVQTPGSKVEQQFANDNLYHVRVPAGSIYDVSADPDGIVSRLRAKGNLDVNVMEKAIQKAGYKGYNNSDYYPEYVKLYGKHEPIPVPDETLLSRAQARRENVAQNWGDKRRPFADRLADQEKIAANAAAFKARMYPEATSALPAEAQQIGDNAAAYKASKRHAGNSDAEGVLAQESVRGATAHPLADAIRQEGKVNHLGDNDVVIDFRGKKYYGTDGATSAYDDAVSKIPVPEKFGPKRTTVGPNETVPPFWGTRLHSALTDKGGFTIDPETGADLTSGYSVGGGEKSGVLLKKPLADLKPTELQSFMNANKSKLQPGQAWGGWVQNGHVYVEPADQVGDLNEAQRLGNERGEQAIWDHANGKEIPLKAAKADAAAEAATAQDPYRALLEKWHANIHGYKNTLSTLPDIMSQRGRDMLAAKKNPYGGPLDSPHLAIFDPSKTVLNENYLGPHLPPGVTADAVPTKVSTRADLSQLDALPNKFKKQFTPHVIAGLKENPKWGGWYDLSELKKAFTDLLPDGEEAFNKAMQFLGPTSTATKTPMNLRQGSYFYHLWKSGKLNPEALANGTMELPPGYANMRQSSVNKGIAKIINDGALDPNKLQKTGRYAGQLGGTLWNSGVLDMHGGRTVGEPGTMYNSKTGAMEPGVGYPTPSFAKNKKVTSSPPDSHYPVYEKAMQDEAKRLGMPTAVYQALGWLKNGANTGVSDTRTMLELYNDAFRRTANKFGYSTPTEAMKAWIKGETPLW